MTVSEIITRLACSTLGLKLTPCPKTHTHTHTHTYTSTSTHEQRGPLLGPIRPVLNEYKGLWGLARHLVGHCSGPLNEVWPVAAGTGAGSCVKLKRRQRPPLGGRVIITSSWERWQLWPLHPWILDISNWIESFHTVYHFNLSCSDPADGLLLAWVRRQLGRQMARVSFKEGCRGNGIHIGQEQRIIVYLAVWRCSAAHTLPAYKS